MIKNSIWFKKSIARLFRIVLGLRYRVTVTGLEKLKGVRSAFILPNHPAEIDPVILASELYRAIDFRPVVLEEYYYAKSMHFFMRLLKAIAMPDMSYDAGVYKRKRVQSGLDEVVAGLENGENVLLYPAGSLCLGGIEKIGARFGVNYVLQRATQAKVFLVKTKGLYGSVFSKAITGKSPNFVAVALSSMVYLVKNIIFFTPRREVTICIEEVPSSFPRNADVLVLNKWLEAYYNKEGEVTPSLVSRSMWSQDLPTVVQHTQSTRDVPNIIPEIREKVIKFISQISHVSEDKILLQSKLGEDLAIDSLAIVEILQWLDAEFAVVDVDVFDLETVGDIMRIAGSDGIEGNVVEIPEPSINWQSAKKGNVFLQNKYRSLFLRQG